MLTYVHLFAGLLMGEITMALTKRKTRSKTAKTRTKRTTAKKKGTLKWMMTQLRQAKLAEKRAVKELSDFMKKHKMALLKMRKTIRATIAKKTRQAQKLRMQLAKKHMLAIRKLKREQAAALSKLQKSKTKSKAKTRTQSRRKSKAKMTRKSRKPSNRKTAGRKVIHLRHYRHIRKAA